MGKGRAYTFKEKLEMVSLAGRIPTIYGHVDFLFHLVYNE